MFYAILEDGNELTWHIGMSNSLIQNHANEIVQIQADGDELHHINGRFQNIPQSLHSNVVQWYGESAKFIAANLSNT